MSNRFDNLSDVAFFSKLSNFHQAPFGDGLVTSLGDYALQGSLNHDVLSDEGSDLARLNRHPSGGSACGFDDMASQYHQSQQTISGTTGRNSQNKSPRKPTKRPRPEARRRREVNLEKNRLAANRCRQRKRDWTSRLDNEHRQLLAHNKLLRAEMASLNDTVFELKELALGHADCGFRPIDEYVRQETQRVEARARGTRCRQ